MNITGGDVYDHSYFGPGVLTTTALISAAGMTLNYHAMRYVKDNFNLEVTIFFLVYIDTLASFTSCTAFLVVSFLMLLNMNMPVMCSLIFIILYPPSAIGMTITAEVAIIR